MDNYGEEKLVQEIITYSEEGDLESLRTTMSKQDQAVLLNATLDAVSKISPVVMDKIKDMYIETIRAHIEEDLKTMEKKEFVIRKYTDLIEKATNGLDTKDTVQTNNAILLISKYREVLQDCLDAFKKEKSFLGRIFGK